MTPEQRVDAIKKALPGTWLNPTAEKVITEAIRVAQNDAYNNARGCVSHHLGMLHAETAMSPKRMFLTPGVDAAVEKMDAVIKKLKSFKTEDSQ